MEQNGISQKSTKEDKSGKLSVIQNSEPQPNIVNKREVEELREDHEQLSQATKDLVIRGQGYLSPHQVNPKVHTYVGPYGKYIERVESVGINVKKLNKIRTLILKEELNSKFLVEDHKKQREQNPNITRARKDNFTFRGYEGVHIQTPEQAYKHFVKYGHRYGGEYPFKYIEDDDCYILSGGKRSKPVNDFSEGVAIIKKGGLILRWSIEKD